MNKFKDEVVNILAEMCKSENFRANSVSPGYREIACEAIRQYYGITPDGKNTWKNIELYKRHHKFTERATLVIDSYDGNPKELWKQLQYEHMEPVSQIRDKIFQSQTSAEQIRVILDQSEVLILSKEEATVLDGSTGKLYKLDGGMVSGKGMRMKGTMPERLEAIGAKIDPRFMDNNLN